MKEIVGANINGKITNNPKLIASAIELSIPLEFLDRKRMQFMACCDLGIRWEKMATGPTLFRLDEKGIPHAP